MKDKLPKPSYYTIALEYCFFMRYPIFLIHYAYFYGKFFFHKMNKDWYDHTK